MTGRSTTHPSVESTRRALVTVCVLVCLLVATSLAMHVLRSATSQRRELGLRHQMLQTEFLLDAGVQRARNQLKSAADYQGETWTPSAAIPQFPAAEVVIRLSDDQHTVHVIATLGVTADDELRIAADGLRVAADGLRVAANVTRRSHQFSIATTTPPAE